MKALKILFLVVAVTLCAGLATAQVNKEVYALCTGDGTDCIFSVATVNWGQDTYVEITIDADVGCPINATYNVVARNPGAATGSLITTLSIKNVRSQVFIPQQWYQLWAVEASDITGCTGLVINLYVVRPPVTR